MRDIYSEIYIRPWQPSSRVRAVPGFAACIANAWSAIRSSGSDTMGPSVLLARTTRNAMQCARRTSASSLSLSFFSGNLIVRLIISLMIDEPAIRIPGTKNDPAQRLWSSTETFNDPSCSVSLLAHAPPLRELQAEYYFNYVRDSLRAMTRCAEV